MNEQTKSRELNEYLWDLYQTTSCKEAGEKIRNILASISRVSGEPPKPASNFMQIIKQSDEEKHKIYMNIPKEELCKMLIASNHFIETIEPKVTNFEKVSGGLKPRTK